MLLTFSAPRVWPKSRRVAPPPTLCASREWEWPFRRVPRLWDLLKALSLVEGLPCRDRLQRKSIALMIPPPGGNAVNLSVRAARRPQILLRFMT